MVLNAVNKVIASCQCVLYICKMTVTAKCFERKVVSLKLLWWCYGFFCCWYFGLHLLLRFHGCSLDIIFKCLASAFWSSFDSSHNFNTVWVVTAAKRSRHNGHSHNSQKDAKAHNATAQCARVKLPLFKCACMCVRAVHVCVLVRRLDNLPEVRRGDRHIQCGWIVVWC